MQVAVVILLFTLSCSVSAHFQLMYPEWRADSFTTPGALQWIWPCANINTTSGTNRTLWPTKGGSLMLNDSHPDALTFVNLGLGNEVTSFNVSLLSHFNQTGNGTLCLQSLGGEALAELAPANGMNASIQVVTINPEGNALYNCADITFSDDASLLSTGPGGSCHNATGVSGMYIGNLATTSTNGSDASTTSESASSSSSAGAGGAVHAPAAAALMIGVVGIGAFVGL
ncbi:hypothetical protein NA57DRAFT_66719 [Rhizodiscina lignyota]|uniref:Copper acquisition factor BIM1-like domain-containing protein n=1 Tax=Rhizodiscina lignyota TaxID=1504668 RepID=A0A9P4IE98_9PEZI|nr:hypothetical protein NA57DRAFT_66719 [Rhizodiscina lignyota]